MHILYLQPCSWRTIRMVQDVHFHANPNLVQLILIISWFIKCIRLVTTGDGVKTYWRVDLQEQGSRALFYNDRFTKYITSVGTNYYAPPMSRAVVVFRPARMHVHLSLKVHTGLNESKWRQQLSDTHLVSKESILTSTLAERRRDTSYTHRRHRTDIPLLNNASSHSLQTGASYPFQNTQIQNQCWLTSSYVKFILQHVFTK